MGEDLAIWIFLSVLALMAVSPVFIFLALLNLLLPYGYRIRPLLFGLLSLLLTFAAAVAGNIELEMGILSAAAFVLFASLIFGTCLAACWVLYRWLRP